MPEIEPTAVNDGRPNKGRDSARMGKATEHLVAATCILMSGAELNVSTALVDDEGVDLVFHRRDATKTIAVQVKSRMSDSTLRKLGRFSTEVRAQTFRPREDLFLLFVPVDLATGNFDHPWLVPSQDFASSVKPDKHKRLRFAASTDLDSKDQWRKYRVLRHELPNCILRALDERERNA